MKVLHLVGGSLSGGAGLGAVNLHRSLLSEGIDSKILTNEIGPSTTDVFRAAKGFSGKISNAVRRRYDEFPLRRYHRQDGSLFSIGNVGIDVSKRKEFIDADIVHLHWINNAFINLDHISKSQKPFVWTLRDMWLFTGGCHYSLGCTKFVNGCGSCPQLNSMVETDLSQMMTWRKRRNLPNRLQIVGISNWIAKIAEQSYVLNGHKVRVIPNSIDCNAFYPEDKAKCRKDLSLSTSKTIILFGAQSLSLPYKGLSQAIGVLKLLDPDNYFIACFGHGRQLIEAASLLGFECRDFDFVSTSSRLRNIYSAADVFVSPSTMEAFGKTTAEALACGTPVVAFRETGADDILDHRIQGYLALQNDTRDLLAGIKWCGANKHNISRDSLYRHVLLKFNGTNAAKEYLGLYQSMLSERSTT